MFLFFSHFFFLPFMLTELAKVGISTPKNLMNYWLNNLIYFINATNRGLFLGELWGERVIKYRYNILKISLL